MEQKIDMLESERTIIEMGWKLEIVVFIWPKNLFIWVIMVFVSYLLLFLQGGVMLSGIGLNHSSILKFWNLFDVLLFLLL